MAPPSPSDPDDSPKPGIVQLQVKPVASAPSAPIPDAPSPKIVAAAESVVSGAQIKKGAFLDRALARTNVKRSDAKPAIEAALAELAAILSEGDEVNIPPLGKIRVVKSKRTGDGAQILTLKLRTVKDDANPLKTGVADRDDDG